MGVGLIHLSEYCFNGFDTPYNKVEGSVMIPAFDVLQGGIGKFINLIQKHRFSQSK